MSKAELRGELRRRREDLPVELVAGWSASIVSRLTELDEYRLSSAIHCYVSSLPGEVLTEPLIAGALEAHRRVICPRVRPHGQLEHREIVELSQLQNAAFGLREPDPERAAPVSASLAELVVVPGLAFSADGSRLGMGGGYYDRFLAQVDAPVVGLGFEMQMVDGLPMASHDRRVDLVVTELRVIRCR